MYFINSCLVFDFAEAEEIRLDRWTVVFRPQSEESEGADGRVTAASAQVYIYFYLFICIYLCLPILNNQLINLYLIIYILGQ